MAPIYDCHHVGLCLRIKNNCFFLLFFFLDFFFEKVPTSKKRKWKWQIFLLCCVFLAPLVYMLRRETPCQKRSAMRDVPSVVCVLFVLELCFVCVIIVDCFLLLSLFSGIGVCYMLRRDTRKGLWCETSPDTQHSRNQFTTDTDDDWQYQWQCIRVEIQKYRNFWGLKYSWQDLRHVLETAVVPSWQGKCHISQLLRRTLY